MRLSLYLAKRLSISSSGGTSPALRVSVAAVALSVAVMIASLGVVLGFKNEIRHKVYGFNSHLTVYDASSTDPDEESERIVTVTERLASILDSEPYISEWNLQASLPAILKTDSEFKGVYLRSVAPNSSQSRFLKENLIAGKLPGYDKDSDNRKIAISKIAANQLSLKVGDRIYTYFIDNSIRVRPLEIAAIYDSHFDAYDDVLVYASLPLIQEVAGLGERQGSAIVIETVDPNRIDEWAPMLGERLISATATGELYRYYQVDNARNQGAGFFSWLDLLDTNVAVILVLMALVSVATLISGLLILVLDKRRFIVIVRSLGLSGASVSRVFVWLALRIAIVGMTIGNVLMITFLAAQKHWHFLRLDAESYYIDFVPVELDWGAFGILNLATIVFIYLALLIPSRIAARTDIAPATHTE
ncbi:MAG: ABC transporter permease [Muribaculaceae bacterium]|nr:ABC transporter permease [Muribaculaceae bacterium]